jgi:hypothetical protein
MSTEFYILLAINGLELVFLLAVLARIIAHTKEHYILMNIFRNRQIQREQQHNTDYVYPGEARHLDQDIIPVVLHV